MKNRFEATVTFVVDMDANPDWHGAELVPQFDAIGFPWFLVKEVHYANGKRLSEWGYKRPTADDLAARAAARNDGPVTSSECAFPDCECPGEEPVCDDYGTARNDGEADALDR